jgi:hypothetical protein
MNKRDYLRSQGFNVGERGRFNDAMKTCIAKAQEEGIHFNDIPTPKVEKLYVKEEIKPHTFKPQPKLRSSRELFGYTHDGIKIAFITCRQCRFHMIYCSCTGGVQAPKLVVRSNDPLVRI